MNYLEIYAQLATEELLRLIEQKEALTGEAQQALEAELQRRGLSVEDELAIERELADAQQAEREAEAQAKNELTEDLFWDKLELWTQLLLWEFVAAVFAILAPLCVGEFNVTTIWRVTENFVLVGLVGALISSSLPERWNRVKVTLAISATVFLAISAVWVWRR